MMSFYPDEKERKRMAGEEGKLLASLLPEERRAWEGHRRDMAKVDREVAELERRDKALKDQIDAEEKERLQASEAFARKQEEEQARASRELVERAIKIMRGE